MNGPLSLHAWLFAGAAVGLVALLVFAYARRGANSGLGRRALLLAALALAPAAAALGVDWGLDEVLENPEPQGSAVLAMAVSPDGGKAATADLSGETRIYNLADGSFVAGPSFATAMPRVAALHMLKNDANEDLLVAISDQSSIATTGPDPQQVAPYDLAEPYLLSLVTGNELFIVEGSTIPANDSQKSARGGEFDVGFFGFRGGIAKPILYLSHLLVRPTTMAVVMPVARLQAALTAFGIKDLPPDGIVGSRTIDAVNQFQQQNGLRVTGKADAATIDKILELKLADIGSLQILLGFADGRIAVIDQLLQGPITKFSLDTSNLSKSPQTDAPTPTPRPILRIASDGTGRIATADADGHLSLWAIDPKSGQPAKDTNFDAATEIVLAGHDNSVLSALFSPDGTQIVTGSSDDTARLWVAATGSLVGSMRVSDAVSSARFSPDGKNILTISSGNEARLWNAATFTSEGQPMQHGDRISSATFSPDGKRLLTASADSTARIWDAETGQPIGAVMKHNTAVEMALFSPDGARIVTAAADGTARLWDGRTGAQVGNAMTSRAGLKSAVVSPDWRRLTTVSERGEIRLWDISTQDPLEVPKRIQNINAIAISPDGGRAAGINEATGEPSLQTMLFDVTTGSVVGEFVADGGLDTVLFSPDGTRLAGSLLDHTVLILDAVTGSQQVLENAGNLFAFSPNGTLLVTGASGNTARVWNTSTSLPAKAASCVGCLSLSFDVTGKTIEATDYAGRIRRFDARTGKQSGEGAAWAQGHVVALDDGRYVDSCADGSVFIYDPAAGTKIELVAHTAMISAAEALPDGRIVTADIDGAIHVIDPAMQSYFGAVDPWPVLRSGVGALAGPFQRISGSTAALPVAETPPAQDKPPATGAPPATDAAPAGVVPPAQRTPQQPAAN